MGDDQHKNGYVMTETIFACKQVKEFPCQKGFSILAPAHAIFPRLTKDFFMGNSPGNACYRYGQNKKPDQLGMKVHVGVLKD
jgi:hypothetical protein